MIAMKVSAATRKKFASFAAFWDDNVYSPHNSKNCDEEARSDFFQRIKAKGWIDGSPLPGIHYAVSAAHGTGIERALPRGRRL